MADHPQSTDVTPDNPIPDPTKPPGCKPKCGGENDKSPPGPLRRLLRRLLSRSSDPLIPPPTDHNANSNSTSIPPFLLEPNSNRYTPSST